MRPLVAQDQLLALGAPDAAVGALGHHLRVRELDLHLVIHVPDEGDDLREERLRGLLLVRHQLVPPPANDDRVRDVVRLTRVGQDGDLIEQGVALRAHLLLLELGRLLLALHLVQHALDDALLRQRRGELRNGGIRLRPRRLERRGLLLEKRLDPGDAS